MKKSGAKIFLWLTCPVPLVFLMILQRDEIRRLASLFPPCFFNRITGRLCPACGNTRSVLALLGGDFITSIRFNITPAVVCVIVLLLYIEKLFAAFGKKIFILPRNNIFWLVFLVMIFFYYVFRSFI